MMDAIAKAKLRDFLRQSLDAAGDARDFSDDSSLFVSGRLDSLTMTRLVMFLEDTFGVDFADIEFDVELIDSAGAIQDLVAEVPRAVLGLPR